MSRRVRIKPEAKLVSHRTVAAWLSVPTKAIRTWVGKGEFPMPHSEIGQTWFYQVGVVEHFIKTGRWPDGVRFHRFAHADVLSRARSGSSS